MRFKIAIAPILLALIFSCRENRKISLDEFNKSGLVSNSSIFYSDASEFQACALIKDSHLTFSIWHEKDINLRKYKVIIRFNGYVVYNDVYHEKIEFLAKTCLNNSQSITITIYDDKNYFRWKKKSAYKISNYSEANIILLSENNFMNSNNDQYKITLR